jgi:hypothetical protein
MFVTGSVAWVVGMDSSEIAPPPGKPDGASLELLAEIEELIAALEQAASGDAALDKRLHYTFCVAHGQSPDLAALLIDEGVSWPVAREAVDAHAPPYTTKLDSALPGETVTLILRSDRKGEWGAMQRSRCGSETLGWAATDRWRGGWPRWSPGGPMCCRHGARPRRPPRANPYLCPKRPHRRRRARRIRPNGNGK